MIRILSAQAVYQVIFDPPSGAGCFDSQGVPLLVPDGRLIHLKDIPEGASSVVVNGMIKTVISHGGEERALYSSPFSQDIFAVVRTVEEARKFTDHGKCEVVLGDTLRHTIWIFGFPKEAARQNREEDQMTLPGIEPNLYYYV